MKGRWRNLVTLFVLGPGIALSYYAFDLVVLGMHPLDRLFYLPRFLAVGCAAGAIAAMFYGIYWIFDRFVRPNF